MTAGRGRGKSAALGLAVAAAVAHGYANIFLTAPSPENLGTVRAGWPARRRALGVEKFHGFYVAR